MNHRDTWVARMGVRYELSDAPRRLKAFFDLDAMPPQVASGEVQPGDSALIIRPQLGHSLATPATWGMDVPSVTLGREGEKLSCVHAEAIPGDPTLRALLKRRRCLVPATAIYVRRTWNSESESELLRLVHRDGIPLALAGLWESSHPAGADEAIDRYALLFAEADGTAPWSTRLPVILDEADWEVWLAPKVDHQLVLQSLLQLSSLEGLVVAPPAERSGWTDRVPGR